MDEAVNAAMELLNRMLQTKKIGVTVVWRSAQWCSSDGLPGEFSQLYRSHGIPAKIEFWEDGVPVDSRI